MTRDVFISYSRDNYDSVIEIKRQIDAAVCTECWIDLKVIESGAEQFPDDIIDGINNCKVFLFMLTEQSQESKWALRELAFAEKKKKHVVIVNIDGVEMNDRFSFKYGLTDTIAWNDKLQRDKLIQDLCHWIDITHRPQSITPIPSQELGELNKTVGKLRRSKGANGKWGFIDMEGKIVIPHIWDHVGNFVEGLAKVKDSNGKCGFINKTGKIVVPCTWDGAGCFSMGVARVKDSNGKWGYIYKNGKIVIPCIWDDACDFKKGAAKVKDSNGRWVWINKFGKVNS